MYAWQQSHFLISRSSWRKTGKLCQGITKSETVAIKNTNRFNASKIVGFWQRKRGGFDFLRFPLWGNEWLDWTFTGKSERKPETRCRARHWSDSMGRFLLCKERRFIKSWHLELEFALSMGSCTTRTWHQSNGKKKRCSPNKVRLMFWVLQIVYQ